MGLMSFYSITLGTYRLENKKWMKIQSSTRTVFKGWLLMHCYIFVKSVKYLTQFLNDLFDRYGRSYKMKRPEPRSSHRCQSRTMKFFHIIYSSIVGFRPSPQSLKDDALIVCRYVLKLGVQNLIIHGESIGGMAAAHTAKILSTEQNGNSKDNEILLICDRTFGNLIAVARKMVGEWTRHVIPYLVPDWSTDVTGDYISAKCRKIGEIIVTFS